MSSRSALFRRPAARRAVMPGLAAACLAAAWGAAVAPAAAVSPEAETRRIAEWLAGHTGQRIDPEQLRVGEVDLNGDGRAEVVAIYLNVIHCNGSGCDGWLLRQDGGRLEEIGRFSAFELPRISVEGSSHGWPDLLIHDALNARDMVYRFDGQAYRPHHPHD